MPNLTGLELAAACHTHRPNLPVILCTGFSEAVAQYENNTPISTSSSTNQ